MEDDIMDSPVKKQSKSRYCHVIRTHILQLCCADQGCEATDAVQEEKHALCVS